MHKTLTMEQAKVNKQNIRGADIAFVFLFQREHESSRMEGQNIRIDIPMASHVWEPRPTDWWGLSGAVFKSTPVLRM